MQQDKNKKIVVIFLLVVIILSGLVMVNLYKMQSNSKGGTTTLTR